MIDVASLNLADFAPHTGTSWRVVAAGPGKDEGAEDFRAPVVLDLIEVAPGAEPPAGRPRRSFSLLFRGPQRLYLPQRIYRLEHDAIGALDLFLVPIAPDSQGSLFQAVFN
jgi:hypothetical protein